MIMACISDNLRAASDPCDCQSLLLHGYMHNAERRTHLSHAIPTKIHDIAVEYYDTQCHNRYFDGHLRPKWITNTSSFSNFLLKLSKMLSHLLSSGTRRIQWEAIFCNHSVDYELLAAEDTIDYLLCNNIQTYLAVKS